METAIWITLTLLQALIFGTIFRKAGFSGYLGFLMAVPLVNLGTLLWFATTTWPVERGYTAAPGNTKVDAAWELKMVLRRAATLEKAGQSAEAVQHLEDYALKLGENHANSAMIQERIAALKTGRGA